MSGNQTAQRPFPVEGLLALLGGYSSEMLTGAKTLDATYGNVIKFDPGGASRDVTGRAVTECKGVFLLLVNGADAAENLVYKNAGGDTIGTVNQNEAGLFYCDGSTWALVFVFTIALS